MPVRQQTALCRVQPLMTTGKQTGHSPPPPPPPRRPSVIFACLAVQGLMVSGDDSPDSGLHSSCMQPPLSYKCLTAYERGGGRPGLPVPNSPYGLCGRKATCKLPATSVSTVLVGVWECAKATGVSKLRQRYPTPIFPVPIKT